MASKVNRLRAPFMFTREVTVVSLQDRSSAEAGSLPATDLLCHRESHGHDHTLRNENNEEKHHTVHTDRYFHAYNERFTNVSKFIILAPGDEVSMPDNSRYYFPYLEGEKHLQRDFRMRIGAGNTFRNNVVKWTKTNVDHVKHPLGWENITGYDIMAYSWWRFMNDSAAPPHWLVQFPMVKATVRAMDTVTDYVMKTYYQNITQFTLTGVSMAGWVTWLTAAVDRRVAAIIPIGMDLLNFTENFHHQYRVYCGWSYMLRPFYEMNITQVLDNPCFSDLASHVDPLAYNQRYTNISKYIIIASGDEFFQPDNSHNYFFQLEGEKHLQIIPNIDYRFQDNLRLLKTILVYYSYIINNELRPFISWQRATTNTSGIIYFNSSSTPSEIFSYHADTVDGSR
ncbi:autocrine proliferation repressor protein A-like [Eublepharis macularius]|uniref:Autocrine proliferation repressor protein A-like n=1 Tax=Eublepharis macularius TaxID=481883 RepID=A0AA97KUI5_EUBMA|nr:autocrine proliferation repressor protein A-like [Eublepharis macularius]